MTTPTLAEAISQAVGGWNPATRAIADAADAARGWFAAFLSSPEVKEGAAMVLDSHEYASASAGCHGCDWTADDTDEDTGTQHARHAALATMERIKTKLTDREAEADEYSVPTVSVEEIRGWVE